MGRMRGYRVFGIASLAIAAAACGDNENVGPIGDDQVVETDEDTAIDIALAGSDANGDQLEFAIIASPLSGTLSGTAPAVTYTPDEDFFGADMFTYAVSDAEKTETFDVAIMVRPVNDGPVISVAAAEVTTDEDQPAGPVVIAIADVDDDAATLAVEASSANTDVVDAGGIEIDRTTGDVELTLTPVPDASGTAQITLAVTDAAGESANASFDLEVVPVNDAPTISDIADQSTQRDPISDIAFTIADVDDLAADLTVTPASDNQAVVPDANITIGGAGADRTVSVTPIASGTATITVTVSDGTASADDVFSFEVTNNAPNAVADTYAAVGNTVLIIASGAGLLANDSDDDAGDPFNIVDPGAAVPTTAGGLVLINAADGGFTYTPPAGITGVADTFTYELTDGFETSTGTATINLSELVWYVDNSVAATGDGRSHSPFATLAEAESDSGPGDIIYVASGDGTSDGYDAGISLEDGQQLIGSGVELVVNGVTLRSAGDNPVITNTDGVGVELDASNTVAGLTIDQPTNDGISGPAVTSLVLDRVTINAGGNAAIDIGNNNPAGLVTIDITSCAIDGTGASGAQLGIDVDFGRTGGTGTLELDISDNELAEVDDGVLLNLEGTTGTGADGANRVIIDTNTITNFSGAALDLRTDGSSNNDLFLLGNTINGAGTSDQAGIEVLVGHGDAAGVTDLTADGNHVTGAGSECLLLHGGGEGGNAGTLNALLDDNDLIGCTDEGLRVFPDDAATYNVRAINNTITGNGGDTTFEFASNTAAFLRVLLGTNEDDQGYVIDCDDTGDIELAGVNNLGSTLDCNVDTDDAVFEGHLADQANTTGGGPPAGSLTGTGANTIEIVDAATIPSPQ